MLHGSIFEHQLSPCTKQRTLARASMFISTAMELATNTEGLYYFHMPKQIEDLPNTTFGTT